MSDDNNQFTTEELTDLNESTKEILLNLTAKEVKILRSRFGIDFSKDNNLDDLGRQFDVTRKRIQEIEEIEEKALKKLKATKEKVQNCSFCGKSINEVKRMIVSEINNVFICNECIKNCGDLLDE
jgi:DNA-directed RNA polymerase sigma subunit (sigma70/sigma32)